MAHHNVKRVTVAPKWFDIGKYSKLDKLTNIELYEQFFIRYCLLDEQLEPDNRKRLLDATRIMGIARLSSTSIKDVPLPTKWVDEGFRTNTARLLTCEDVFNFSLSEEVKNACWAEGKLELFTDMRFYYDALKPYDLYLAESKHALEGSELHIAINLESSDQQIKDDLEKLIGSARKKFNIEQGFKGTKPIHFHKWINYRVLPYLDIDIWAKEKEIEVSDEDLIGWLYPEDSEAEHSPKELRTIRKSAEYLMSENTLRHLTYLIPD